MKKRLIGLTGGIATGKTTVANYLASAYNLPVLDADIYARDTVTIGSPILGAIAQRYGTQILSADGSLNRQYLGEVIFNSPQERHWLEGLIHPQVRKRSLNAIAESPAQTLVLVIPLLFEAEMTDLVTEIWVVSCSQQQQIQRLIQRNNLNTEQAIARINSQLSMDEKVSRADVVLDNSSTLALLLKQVDEALKKGSND
ncbi:dephospho-CoA kinase [Cylindrospermum sp. FACHB-282]|uniref:dephospho-CoA kinase n=1 Tax=Cylindrospermum sp. FACHB-282 TaxID=2692794 RepID=UPI00168272FC|nr:dephospho-CoA kinase [Cylindrospermum sp. FACHB-282]MBD2384117.1 dephospho-CoA kinase [Cylindrospermum sp. FACHB-282]